MIERKTFQKENKKHFWKKGSNVICAKYGLVLKKKILQTVFWKIFRFKSGNNRRKVQKHKFVQLPETSPQYTCLKTVKATK